MGRLAKGFLVAAGNVVDSLLVGFHTAYIIRETCPCGRRFLFTVLVFFRLRFKSSLEPDEVGKFFPVRVVAVQTFLERPVELGYEGFILRGITLRKLSELAEQFLDRSRLNSRENPVLLQNLAAHVKRKILAVNNTPDKAEIYRQKLLLVVGNKHAFHKKLHAAFIVGMEHVERCFRGNVKERGVLLGSFSFGVHVQQRIIGIVGNRLVKRDIVLVLEIALGFLPHGARVVDLLGNRLLAFHLALVIVFFLFIVQIDGEGDVIRVALHNVFNFPPGSEFLVVVIEIHDHAGSVTCFFNAFDNRKSRRIHAVKFIGALSVRHPFPYSICPGFFGYHFNLRGDHEG